jgi:hypothetical protein
MIPPVNPTPPRVSQYNIDPSRLRKRAVELPGITSVSLFELFPDLPRPLYRSAGDLQVIRRATAQAMAGMDTGRIKPGDSVNILASHHGFTIAGGKPYAEMLRTIRDEVERVTGTKDIRLRAGVGLRVRETEEYIQDHNLNADFHGKAIGIAPIDEGIPIPTDVGTLYGIKKAYDAKWIIHAHNNHLRELHHHRQVDRALKPFAMSYARIETRSIYHTCLGPRSSNIVSRAIYESDLVQEKLLFSIFLVVNPTGVIAVDADRDLNSLNDRLTRVNLTHYGRLTALFDMMKECIVIIDFPGPLNYAVAGGVIFGNLMCASIDEFDLDAPYPAFSRYSESLYDRNGSPFAGEIAPFNPAIKALVINYVSKGLPVTFDVQHMPTIVVKPHGELFNSDPQNPNLMQYAVEAENLEGAVDFAKRIAGTDRMIIFDGAPGGFNCSGAMREYLLGLAPRVSDRWKKELLPKWLKQRNMSLDTVGG